MKLYFLRHAIAAEPGAKGIHRDSDRPLTEDGIRETKNSLHGFKTLGLQFDAVASSPYLRAKHTAEIVVEGLKLKQKIVFTDALTPHAEWKDFYKFIKGFAGKEKVLVAGHQPTLGQFISSLICHGSDAQINIKKGSLALVEVNDDLEYGELEWLMTAKQLSEL